MIGLFFSASPSAKLCYFYSSCSIVGRLYVAPYLSWATDLTGGSGEGITSTDSLSVWLSKLVTGISSTLIVGRSSITGASSNGYCFSNEVPPYLLLKLELTCRFSASLACNVLVIDCRRLPVGFTPMTFHSDVPLIDLFPVLCTLSSMKL